MRSLLFVPADSERKIEKAMTCNADVVILDLEDSVALQNKPAARALAAQTLQRPRSGPQVYVRVNALDSGLTSDDVAAVLPAGPEGIIQPKTETGACVDKLAGMVGTDMPVIAIATETANAMFGLGTYTQVTANLKGIAWGAEDLSNELGAQANRTAGGSLTEPYRLARSLCLFGARAAGVEPVDTVYVDFRNQAGLEHDCMDAVRDGFTCKMAIHPAQVDTINRIFTPSAQQVAEARSIIDAFAGAGDAGVVGIDGKMYDIPHLNRSRKLLHRAKAYGVT
ncbi:aldolase/citrate lyase family protein [Anderseniella sp. Alg231-50]|uniref:aldolase/citrate lyase family protein n=1 Tax=Anderseniella sp. Alg231-50 TaxID=1922226 RepID=UPI000D562BB0